MFWLHTDRTDSNEGASVPGLGAFLSQNAHPNSELIFCYVWVRLGHGLSWNLGYKHCWH